jgi:arylsulfatase A-like enzyme
VDIAPTTLGLCGIRPPSWMEGTDYSALRIGGPEPELPDSAYLQSVIPTGHGDSVNRPWRGIVTRDGWKYVCLERMPFMLFNLHEDSFEQVNMAFNNRYRAERHRLQARLAQWIADTGDRFDLPDDP